VSVIRAISSTFFSLLSMIWRLIASFDRRDVFVFGGLSMMGYGLHIYSPALCFSICGGILLLIGIVGYAFGGRI